MKRTRLWMRVRGGLRGKEGVKARLGAMPARGRKAGLYEFLDGSHASETSTSTHSTPPIVCPLRAFAAPQRNMSSHLAVF